MKDVTFVVETKDLESGHFKFDELIVFSKNTKVLVYIRGYALIDGGQVFYIN